MSCWSQRAGPAHRRRGAVACCMRQVSKCALRERLNGLGLPELEGSVLPERSDAFELERRILRRVPAQMHFGPRVSISNSRDTPTGLPCLQRVVTCNEIAGLPRDGVGLARLEAGTSRPGLALPRMAVRVRS